MDFSKSKIKYLIIHEIGNKLRDEKVFLSDNLQPLDNHLEKVLLNYFLKPFLIKEEIFNLSHSSDISLNEIYSYSKEVFQQSDESTFIQASQNMAKHLYEYSLHPRIVSGELIIVQISGVIWQNNTIDLIGIFKSETKDSFLKLLKKQDIITIKDDTGINVSKLDKGCLIFNTGEGVGYSVLNIDNHNQATDYWTNKFLNLSPVNNNIHKTKEILKICKSFSEDVLSTDYDTDSEFTFKNNYINYFEDSHSYNLDTFVNKVFENDEIKGEFLNYQKSNEGSFDFNMSDEFELSQKNIKKEKKKIKSTIKLDTNLELKVLLDKDNGTKNIEKGFDESKGMYFYKIYFNEEIK